MNRAWEDIREIQRDVLTKRKNVYMVTGIDLPMEIVSIYLPKGKKDWANAL
ncbi:MAG: hypothetical protein ACYC49_04235 [Ignavibacteriaceae bacterium]